MATGIVYANNASTTLTAPINNSVTSIVVSSATVFPTLSGSQFFYATLWTASSSTLEVVKVTAVNLGTNTLTVARGQQGTGGASWSTGDTIEQRITKGDLNGFNQAPTVSTAGGLVQYADTSGVVLQDMGVVAAGQVIAGPATGPAAAPGPRALVASDIPQAVQATGMYAVMQILGGV